MVCTCRVQHQRGKVLSHLVVQLARDGAPLLLLGRVEAQQQLLPRGLKSLAPDRRRQHIGDRLQEVLIVGGERAPPGGMGAQDTIGPVAIVDNHVHPADHAVVDQQRRRGKAGFDAQIFDHHRPIHQQRVAGLRVGASADRGVPDQARFPAHPRAQQQRRAVRQQLQHLAVLHVERARDQGDGFVQQGGEVNARERPQAKLGARGLLERPRGQLRLGAPALGDLHL
jgi:hypothetical protein